MSIYRAPGTCPHLLYKQDKGKPPFPGKETEALEYEKSEAGGRARIQPQACYPFSRP